VIDARCFTVGPVQENCYVVRAQGADRAVVVDPGEEAPRLVEALEQLGIAHVDGILLTHTHFDHVGAVAPLARATGAPVYCPEIERGILADINSFLLPGFGPFEDYEADELVGGGEQLTLAGLTFDVIFTPGHSPGHVTYALTAPDAEPPALLSGDVLFQGSIGRTDLPGADTATLLASIAKLLDAYPDETVVHPGHMGITTLGAERATNPFLQALAR
jgi:glyoxylase-like metal-dependent hydrolase (beta-lactamase superfamily II)